MVDLPVIIFFMSIVAGYKKGAPPRGRAFQDSLLVGFRLDESLFFQVFLGDHFRRLALDVYLVVQFLHDVVSQV